MYWQNDDKMIFQVAKILQDVRVCLDENRTDTALILNGDEETLRLNEIIRSKIEEGVRRVHMAAPYYLLEQGHNFDEVEGVALYWGDMESGWILLPQDFMRLVVFEMDDWERPVYDVITPDDPAYARCRSRIKGVRGTAERPVCALGVRPAGRVLEFYSCKTEEARMRRGVYIPYPKIEDVTVEQVEVPSVDISERCYDAVVYTVAALTLVSLSETDKAKALFEMSEGLLK